MTEITDPNTLAVARHNDDTQATLTEMGDLTDKHDTKEVNTDTENPAVNTENTDGVTGDTQHG